jgi:TfoX/Sxy family transcriptional regulator of competence genes
LEVSVLAYPMSKLYFLPLAMAYDETLANRIRRKLADLDDVEEKPMMGGLTFMVNGKMCVGIIKGELMCRIDPSEQETVLERSGARVMDFVARPMKGYIQIDDTGIQNQRDFDYWIGLALAYNPKAKASKKKKKA